MIEACFVAFFRLIESSFIIYDLDLQIGVEKFVIAKRMIAAINAKEIAQATGIIDRSKEKSSCTTGERRFQSWLHDWSV
jgi:hypothetical protein